MSLKQFNNKEITLSEKEISNTKSDELSFSRFIKEKRKLIESPSGDKYISTKDLAKKVGIKAEQFRKILNMSKPTNKRDCIIAICAMLKMNSDETNDALTRYNMIPLNTICLRDDHLIDILEEQLINDLSIQEINQRLVRNGFEELDIINHRTTAKTKNKDSAYPYTLTKKKVRSFIDDLVFGNRYDSLDYNYSTNRYKCIAEMWLTDSNNETEYHLVADNFSNYHLQINHNDKYETNTYENIDEAGDFADCFLELENMANKELKRILSLLDDTKNYNMRISAGIMDDSFHVYAETFNYYIPELNEYYLVEFKNKRMYFYVFKKSEFMKKYLNHEEYSSIYGEISNLPLEKYSSIDEILPSDNNYSSTNKYILNTRLKCFKELKTQVDNLIIEIKNKEKYIRHLDYIYEDKDRVCAFFDVEKEYQCSYCGEYEDIMIANKDSYDFNFDDCGKVNITLGDLYQAFELGFNNINEIGRVKKKYGSIKEIINV